VTKFQHVKTNTCYWQSSLSQCYVLAADGNKSATRPPLPLPGCRGEWKQTSRKPVGRDKGSLTEQQTEGTVTTTIQVRRKHNKNRTTKTAQPGEPLSQNGPKPHAPEPQVSSRCPTPPHRNPA